MSRRTALVGMSVVPASLVVPGRAAAESGTHPGLSSDAESIHQEVTFAAPRARVYAALTDAAQFAQVTLLGEARRMLTAPGAAPTAIDARVGGTFTLFGGYITGVQIDLRKDERIVQAWHEHAWDAGEFSLARFLLSDQGPDTRLVFDHRGFPAGAGPHLSLGWYANYWDPMKAFLAA